MAFFFFTKSQDIAKKIKSYSHGEFNTSENINIEKINQKINDNLDIFNRGFKLKKINIDETFPEYIIKNKDLLKDWII